MADISPEEVLAQLKTRGFESSFVRTPLREFWGTLKDIRGGMSRPQEGSTYQPRLEITYYSEDVEVIKSTTPYTDPIVEIVIPQSIRAQSGMGVFGISIDKLINVDENGNPLPDYLEDGTTPNPDIKGQSYLLNKRLHWRLTGGHMQWDGRGSQLVARECWEIVEVQDTEEIEPLPTKPIPKKAQAPVQPDKTATGQSSITKAINLLDGKTIQQFSQAFFNDATLKKDTTLLSKIIGKTLWAEWEAAELVTKDKDGVYHKS